MIMSEVKVLDRSEEVLNSIWYKNMFLCYSDIAAATFDFFIKEKGQHVATLPITTGSISSPMGLGSDSLPVKVNLLGKETYLADSMQFLLEYSLRFDKSGVFYLMPTFRGEDPDNRHLSQFYHAESEIIGELSDVIELCEDYIKYISSRVLSQKYYQNSVSNEKINEIKKIISLNKFPQIKFENALDLIKKNNVDGFDSIDGITTINSKGEKWLMDHFDGVVWLTHFEHKSVPFYQAYDKNSRKYALAADLLIGIGETIGCGQRADYEEVIQSLKEHEVPRDEYEWYINMKEKFPLTTSGFGLGVERYMAWIFGINDIRNVPYVYRDKNRLIYP